MRSRMGELLVQNNRVEARRCRWPCFTDSMPETADKKAGIPPDVNTPPQTFIEVREDGSVDHNLLRRVIHNVMDDVTDNQ